MPVETVVILGCGYTGRRVAERLMRRGIRVIATTRDPDNLIVDGVIAHRFDATTDFDLSFVPDGAYVLYSIPILPPDPTAAIVRAIAPRVRRILYLSTTGVYGAQVHVDHFSPVAPRRPEDQARTIAEAAVLASPCPSIVLRPAAIYGPGRGVHVSMREGRFRLGGDGSNFVSRIHVDDLAAHVDVALWSNATGAWPVADEESCTARQIAEFCSNLLNLPMPPLVPRSELHHTRQANRRVDGSGIRRILAIQLRYPTWREGIPASL